MAGIEVNTAETEFAITSTEVKNWLRITGSDDDTVVGNLVKASHNWAKRYTGRSLTTQTLTMSIDAVQFKYSCLAISFQLERDSKTR